MSKKRPASAFGRLSSLSHHSAGTVANSLPELLSLRPDSSLFAPSAVWNDHEFERDEHELEIEVLRSRTHELKERNKQLVAQVRKLIDKAEKADQLDLQVRTLTIRLKDSEDKCFKLAEVVRQNTTARHALRGTSKRQLLPMKDEMVQVSIMDGDEHTSTELKRMNFELRDRMEVQKLSYQFTLNEMQENFARSSAQERERFQSQMDSLKTELDVMQRQRAAEIKALRNFDPRVLKILVEVFPSSWQEQENGKEEKKVEEEVEASDLGPVDPASGKPMFADQIVHSLFIPDHPWIDISVPLRVTTHQDLEKVVRELFRKKMAEENEFRHAIQQLESTIEAINKDREYESTRWSHERARMSKQIAFFDSVRNMTYDQRVAEEMKLKDEMLKNLTEEKDIMQEKLQDYQEKYVTLLQEHTAYDHLKARFEIKLKTDMKVDELNQEIAFQKHRVEETRKDGELALAQQKSHYESILEENRKFLEEKEKEFERRIEQSKLEMQNVPLDKKQLILKIDEMALKQQLMEKRVSNAQKETEDREKTIEQLTKQLDLVSRNDFATFRKSMDVLYRLSQRKIAILGDDIKHLNEEIEALKMQNGILSAELKRVQTGEDLPLIMIQEKERKSRKKDRGEESRRQIQQHSELKMEEEGLLESDVGPEYFSGDDGIPVRDRSVERESDGLTLTVVDSLSQSQELLIGGGGGGSDSMQTGGSTLKVAKQAKPGVGSSSSSGNASQLKRGKSASNVGTPVPPRSRSVSPDLSDTSPMRQKKSPPTTTTKGGSTPQQQGTSPMPSRERTASTSTPPPKLLISQCKEEESEASSVGDPAELSSRSSLSTISPRLNPLLSRISDPKKSGPMLSSRVVAPPKDSAGPDSSRSAGTDC